MVPRVREGKIDDGAPGYTIALGLATNRNVAYDDDEPQVINSVLLARRGHSFLSLRGCYFYSCYMGTHDLDAGPFEITGTSMCYL